MQVSCLTRKLTGFSQLPSYTDGVATLHEVFHTSESYQRKYIKPESITIHFREKAVYNKTKIEFRQVGVEINAMLVIPFIELKRTSLYAVVLNSEILEVQNASVVVNSNGFKELELTLSQSNIVWEGELNDES